MRKPSQKMKILQQQKRKIENIGKNSHINMKQET